MLRTYLNYPVILRVLGHGAHLQSYFGIQFWKWKEEALEFKASLGYMVRSCLKK